ncbi:MAG: ankyrin repeat domain-containing protein [Rudaea sp.]|uniref:ankyrin repeat domain-containing protein n=1 Tax=Rudaea sp. TaxID=2136325 RepID=UPI001AD17DE5|nr:ankyrin repeat domain-containing protein [Rudaea sp.]MBN8887640.1 ankyrin repeat domain-containing protein [Rudaea sp.]
MIEVIHMVWRSIFAASALLLSQSACSVDDMRKEFPRNFELMSDQVAEGTLDVPISEIFFLGMVQVGKLADAAGRGDTKQMQQLVAQGVPGKRNVMGFLWLLEHGADPNLVSCCDVKRPQLSPMGMAAKGGDSRFLEALLSHGGNPNLTVDDAERTPISYAVTLRRTRNIELLIQHHADLNRVELTNYPIAAAGDSVLELAIGLNYFEVALLLLRAGADPCVKNRSGHTAVSIMVGRGNSGSTQEDREAFPQIVEYLKPYTCA